MSIKSIDNVAIWGVGRRQEPIVPLVESRSDVPVTIDASLCIEGCTLCVDICPLDSLAIHPDSGKAYMYVDECRRGGPARRGGRQRRRRARLRPPRGLRASGAGGGMKVRKLPELLCRTLVTRIFPPARPRSWTNPPPRRWKGPPPRRRARGRDDRPASAPTGSMEHQAGYHRLDGASSRFVRGG